MVKPNCRWKHSRRAGVSRSAEKAGQQVDIGRMTPELWGRLPEFYKDTLTIMANNVLTIWEGEERKGVQHG